MFRLRPQPAGRNGCMEEGVLRAAWLYKAGFMMLMFSDLLVLEALRCAHSIRVYFESLEASLLLYSLMAHRVIAPGNWDFRRPSSNASWNCNKDISWKLNKLQVYSLLILAMLDYHVVMQDFSRKNQTTINLFYLFNTGCHLLMGCKNLLCKGILIFEFNFHKNIYLVVVVFFKTLFSLLFCYLFNLLIVCFLIIHDL